MAQDNTYDLPVIIGAVVVGLITIGIFYFVRPDPIKPAAPVEPATAAVVAQPVAPAMLETSGEAADSNQGSTPGRGGTSTGGPQMQGTDSF